MRSFYLDEVSRAQLEGPETTAVWGVQLCTSYRTLGPARVERMEPTMYCPLSAQRGTRLFKKLRPDYLAGVPPHTAKPQHELVPRRMRVSRRIEKFFCAKRAAATRKSARSKQTLRGGLRRGSLGRCEEKTRICRAGRFWRPGQNRSPSGR